MNRLSRLVIALAGACLLSGCTFNGVYSLPLPGAAASHGSTYKVTVQFADALELVPYAAVKVNYATVGHVSSVTFKDGHANVVCVLPSKVHLPSNAVARVDQTSLLGERFVEIEPPAGGEAAHGQLKSGAVISLAHTNTTATVEEVLSALSLVLNGGGIDQIHTIEHEINKALVGREGVARQSLQQLLSFVTGLDRQKQQILSAIGGLDRLAHTVRTQEPTVTAAIDRMPQALAILADDTPALTHLLTAVQHLGSVAVRVEQAAKTDLVANLHALDPTLTRLASVAKDIPTTLQLILTYPTVDGVECCFFGDYGNIRVTIDLSEKSLQQNFSDLGFPTPKLPSPNSSEKTPSAQLQVPTQWITGASVRDLLFGALQ